ncbi:MBL fold metallo-hydrolase [Pseudomonas sp. P154a]|uniref:alkyl/aryl-sulfatase n=1 Tax=Pseudomonas TaxID=286 RepID=UPI0007210C60|nr:MULTISPECIES: alkyl sulfatase dimerization domain-containing protein [Pseudomonas]MBF6039929.1 MBL fold metallo-hydrolase [Pseudomonas mucoides]CRL51911.1 Metallo-beta-lactamase superfamily protein [Pseudomonas sp. URMO17WK12:I11]
MPALLPKQLVLAVLSTCVVIGAAHAAPNDASDATRKANDALLSYLPFSNKQDFDDANHGFIADLPSPVIKGDAGNTVIDLSQYDYLKKEGPVPATVNPSLWRQSQLLAIRGLFKVVDGIYQVRNIDLANITFVRGKTGWIVIDPLTSAETAKAALALVNDKVEKLPVSAVIFTHSHVDHFAGVRAMVDEADVKSGKVPVIAPEGFMEEAVSENVFAGTAMSRRASYMYGNLLPKDPKGTVSGGLGITTAAGTITLLEPNKLVEKTGETLTVDGIEVVFQMAPGTEAPAEMLFYFPQFKAIDLAEDANHTLHNILTLRGAKVRSAQKWASALGQTIDLWGTDAVVSFGSHHWPQWGNDRVVQHLEKQRDLYKYINDQTLRMANQGMTMNEIAEAFVLPDSLAKEFYNRGYYGNLKHNVRATYQLYLGFWDGNPANFDPLPPVEEAKKYVEMVGADKMIKTATAAYAKGEYRWAATVANQVVFADPKNQAARAIEADALEQMGYQAESGPARNFYLSGAQELRGGVKKMATPNTSSPDIIRGMTTEMFLDFLAIHLNGPRVGEKSYAFNLNFPDTHAKYVLTVQNGVMNYSKDKQWDKADGTVTLNRTTLDDIALGKLKLGNLSESGEVTIDGDKAKFKEMLTNFDTFDFWFTLSEP